MQADSCIDRTVWERLEALQHPDRPDVIVRLLTAYLKDSEQLIRSLRGAWECRDATSVNQIAHRLKSSSGNLGATKLATLCRDLDQLARTNALEGARQLVSDLETEYAEVCRAFREQVTRGTPS